MITAQPPRAALSVSIPWPAPSLHSAIVPVFLPFLGCPGRCLFCAQDIQTGKQAASGKDLEHLLFAGRRALEQRAATGLLPAQLAFYGGTFTALEPALLDLCLDFVASVRREGLISSFRCSTRPDAVDAPRLERLVQAGCACLELGVQSFSDRALALVSRGYTASQAKAACALARTFGLELGVQLLPGMPGVSPEVFLDDVQTALSLGARALRFYPCLVLEGTGLAALWRKGEYCPWEEAETLETLALGWLLARRQDAHVLRMGLAPGEELARAFLAGPWHPALGARVLGLSLLLAAKDLLQRLRAFRPHLERSKERLLLEAPAFVQGHFWGQAGEWRTCWADLGLGRSQVRFQHEPRLRLSLL